MLSSADIGPKAASLRSLEEAGLPVPPAFFLGTDAYLAHAERAGLPEMLSSAGSTPLDWVTVREALHSQQLDPDVAAALASFHAELGGGPVAVRSSANAEDLPDASFAGQHGTYFVSSTDELCKRVVDCWASLFSEHAVAYRERNRIPHASVMMAVIVQRLVDAVAAGVAFTAGPMDGSNDVCVEACLGIGESLVSGKVSPDRWRIAREGFVVTECVAGDKPVRIVVDDAGQVAEEPVAPPDATTSAISDEIAREVAWLALQAEVLFGLPVDCEWAFDGQDVWLLQARPITTLPGSANKPHAVVVGPLVPERDAGPDAGQDAADATIWSNVNTGEILPDVISPLTWSLIYDHAQMIFGGMFDALGIRIDAQKGVGLVGGRVYFNLSLLRSSFAVLPGINLDSVLGGLHEQVEIPPLAPASRADKRKATLRVAVALPSYVWRHTARKARRFVEMLRRDTNELLATVDAHTSAEEAHRVLGVLIGRFARFSDALAFMAVAMIGFATLHDLTHKWFPNESPTLPNRLVAGRGDVASAQAGHALWRLAMEARETGVEAIVLGDGDWNAVRLRIEAPAIGESGTRFLKVWDGFMADYGHHRRGELEMANPTWAERPDYVLRLVRRYLGRDVAEDPMAAHAENARRADEAAALCLAELRNPLKRATFRRVLAWGRASAASRENVKNEAVRWFAAIRKVLLVLGERFVEHGLLDRAEDIFFLTHAEIGAWGEDPSTALPWRSRIGSRRAEHERFERLQPPPTVVGTWDGEDNDVSKFSAKRTLTGMSVSAGVVRGPARVFDSVQADQEVLPGEILVAPFTDPGWTPYFVPAAGIVMDMGGMLSHGSIIAREYGIPAVVNVGPATRVITTGQLLEVDGDNGEVRILS